jgi:hypothetical protein
MTTIRDNQTTLRNALIRAYDHAEDTATKEAILSAHLSCFVGRTAEAAEEMAKVDGLPTWIADELDALFAAALDG